MRIQRSHLVVAGLSLLFGLSLPTLLRAAVTLPHAFANGAVADATEVNANFSTLASATNALDGRLTTAESGVTAASALAASKLTPPVAGLKVMKMSTATINRSMGANETYTQVFNFADGCHTTTAIPILAYKAGGGNAENIVSVNPVDRCQYRIYVHRPVSSWPNMTLTVGVLSIGD